MKNQTNTIVRYQCPNWTTPPKCDGKPREGCEWCEKVTTTRTITSLPPCKRYLEEPGWTEVFMRTRRDGRQFFVYADEKQTEPFSQIHGCHDHDQQMVRFFIGGKGNADQQ